MKLGTVMILIGLTLAGAGTYYFINEKNAEPELLTTVDQVSLIQEDDLKISLFFGRPDLEMDEQDFDEGVLNTELPEELQIDYIYIDDTLCDAERLPHECVLPYAKNETWHKLRVGYKKGAFFDRTIDIPVPEELEKIEILEPAEKPKQNSDFHIKFQDSGADQYLISVNFCEINNDGINPCLEGKQYKLIRLENGLIQFLDQNKDSPSITVINNVIEINDTTLKVNFEDSVEYSITGAKQSENMEGTKFYVETKSAISFERRNLDIY